MGFAVLTLEIHFFSATEIYRHLKERKQDSCWWKFLSMVPAGSLSFHFSSLCSLLIPLKTWESQRFSFWCFLGIKKEHWKEKGQRKFTITIIINKPLIYLITYITSIHIIFYHKASIVLPGANLIFDLLGWGFIRVAHAYWESCLFWTKVQLTIHVLIAYILFYLLAIFHST